MITRRSVRPISPIFSRPRRGFFVFVARNEFLLTAAPCSSRFSRRWPTIESVRCGDDVRDSDTTIVAVASPSVKRLRAGCWKNGKKKKEEISRGVLRRRHRISRDMAVPAARTLFYSVSVVLLCVGGRTSAINSLLAEPSCVDGLKLRCANAGTAAVSELDILECIQLYEVRGKTKKKKTVLRYVRIR